VILKLSGAWGLHLSVARWRFSKPNLGRFGVFGSCLTFSYSFGLYPFYTLFGVFSGIFTSYLAFLNFSWRFSGIFGTF
jgi:hypothetical protein